MEFTDSHCHIQSVGALAGEENTQALWDKARDTNPEDIIGRAQEADVTRLICVGCNLPDSQLAVDFVRSRENCWASIGIHPHEAHLYPENAIARQQFELLATASKVVAIGECGLDYFYELSEKKAQWSALEFQIQLALAHNLPVIFHVREAFDDFWPIFESYNSKAKPIRGVLHSFTDTQANLDKGLSYGLYLGVNGIATFTKNPAQQEMYRRAPLKSLLLETDAPFLTPVPYRGKICEPYHIRTIAEFLAWQRGESIGDIARASTSNARQLFQI